MAMQLAVGVPADSLARTPEGDGQDGVGLDVTKSLASIKACFQHVLCVADIGDGEDFFDLGGDSASAVELALEIEAATGIALPMTAAFDAPTPFEMARLVDSYRGRNGGEPVLLKTGSGAGSLFVFPGAGGAAVGLRQFARGLDTGFAVYGFDTPGLNGKQAPLDRIEALAAYFLPHLRAQQPHGPYYLAGYSVGGLVAFEVARRLRAAGEAVALLGLIDSAMARRHYGLPAVARIWVRRAGDHLRRARRLKPLQAIRYAARHMRSMVFDIVPPHMPNLRPAGTASDAGAEAARRYIPRRYDGRAVLLWTEAAAEFNALDLAWGARIRRLGVRRLPGDHMSAMTTHVASTSAAFSVALAEVAGSPARQQKVKEGLLF
jgi:thioesterase domain-containing protein/acyl carrier protein